MAPEDPTESAAQLAARLGSALGDPGELDDEALLLVERARDLVEAVVETDVPADERHALATELEGLIARLRSRPRDPLILLGRHPDGRLENLTQAGSGRLNPQAIPLEFGAVPPPPASGQIRPVEITARCVLTAAHSGPPHRIHGGVAATILDEVLGVAATAAGATGLTGSLQLRYEAATSYGVPLVVRARYTHSEGRKHHATGELTSDGEITVSAAAVYIGPKSASARQ